MIRSRFSTGLLIPLLSFGMLASCGQHPPGATAASRPQASQSELDEVHSLVQAVKDNPSVKDPNQAGPPIHVDPYPKSAGMHQGANMPMKEMSR